MTHYRSNHDSVKVSKVAPALGVLALSIAIGCSSDMRESLGQATQGDSSNAGARASSGSPPSPARNSAPEPGSGGSSSSSSSANPSESGPRDTALGGSGAGGGGESGKPAAVGGEGAAANNASSGASAPAQGGSGAGTTGGAGATSAAGTGGSSGAIVDDGSYSFARCPNAMPPTAADGKWSDFPPCDGTVVCGGAAHCLPTERLQERLSPDILARVPDCSAGKCVPDQLLVAGKVRFSSCNGDFGDGRCIPQCFAVWVMPLAVIFEPGAYGCGRQEVCAPCINPVDQMPSGACESDMCSVDE